MDSQGIAPPRNTRFPSRHRPAPRQSGVSATTLPPGRLPPPHPRMCRAGTRRRFFSWARFSPSPRWSHPYSWLVIAPPARPCVESSCRNPRGLRRRALRQSALKLPRRTIVQRRVQTLFVVDLLQELADLGTSVKHIPIFRSVYLFLLEGLHERLTSGI